MRAILYTRVSTSSQEEKGTSLESQLAALRKHAKDAKYDVIEHISDTHSGADLWNRPGISKARDRIRARHVDVLVAYAIDRLSRDPAHLIILLDECERHGARLEFVTEKMEDSQEWKLIQYVRGYASAVEREKIRERTMRGRRQKVLRGEMPLGSIDLYGYRRNKAAGKREIYEPEAVIVRRIFRDVLAGKSLHKICNELNSEGVPCPAAGKRRYKDGRSPIWNHSSLARFLNEPSYYGHYVAWRWTRTKSGAVVERPENEQAVLAADVSPPILSRDTYERAREAVKRNTGTITRNEKRPYLLRTMVRCGSCGRGLAVDVESYRCVSRHPRARWCGSRSVSRLKLERWVWQVISELYSDPVRIIARIIELDEEGRRDKGELMLELAEKQKRISKLEAQQRRLLRIASEVGDEGLEKIALEQAKSVAAEIRTIQIDLATLRARRDDEADFNQRVQAMVSKISSNQLPQTDIERHEMLKALGVQVVADNEKWEISVELDDRGFGHNLLTFGPEYRIVLATQAA